MHRTDRIGDNDGPHRQPGRKTHAQSRRDRPSNTPEDSVYGRCRRSRYQRDRSRCGNRDPGFDRKAGHYLDRVDDGRTDCRFHELGHVGGGVDVDITRELDDDINHGGADVDEQPGDNDVGGELT